MTLSNRDQIRMTPEELDRYLETQRTLNVATIGPDGSVHLVAMWFVLEDSCPLFTTYGRSQKVQNVRRDARMTALVESGDIYSELRGAELVGQAEVIEDRDEILRIGMLLQNKYSGGGTLEDVAKAMAKRVAIRLRADRAVTWDHSKLAGAAGH